ncbi:MAG: ATP-binding protein [Bacteroidaceae bacterium]|nr:ATP-binding protein [Bacteroidaceae bacterium]
MSDIRPFTVIIGPSGQGKSTILKLLALFRWFYKMENIRAYLRLAGVRRSPFNFRFLQCLRNVGLEEYVKSTTEIEYHFGDVSISYRHGKLSSLPKSAITRETLRLEKMSFVADSRIAISSIAAKKIQSTSFYLSETFRDFEVAMQHLESYVPTYFDKLKLERVKTSAGVRYLLRHNGKDKPLPLDAASSGTQTALPMMALCRYFSTAFDVTSAFNQAIMSYVAGVDRLSDFRPIADIGEIKQRRVSLHIEEPELSLSPEKQRQMLNEMVATCFTQRATAADYDMSITLTTHSPYIVNQLNLLIKAAAKGTTVEQAAMPYDLLQVYRLNSEGSLRSLKSTSESYIDTFALSEDINEIYDAYDQLD